MRKAVVPVHRIDSDGTIGIKIPDGTWFIEGGKLTKEDIETMAKAYEFALDNRMSNVEAMAEAVGSIGIEVED